MGRAAATRRAREAGPDLALAVSPSRRAVVAKAARGDDHCVADDLCPAGGPHPSGGRRSWRSSLRDHSPEDGRRAGSPVRVGIPPAVDLTGPSAPDYRRDGPGGRPSGPSFCRRSSAFLGWPQSS